MVKYEICYISAKSGPIATKRKANISIELQASFYGRLPHQAVGRESCQVFITSYDVSVWLAEDDGFSFANQLDTC